ncbi:MAG: peptidase MA family metallohydrolase [Planctomycetota bacterium]
MERFPPRREEVAGWLGLPLHGSPVIVLVDDHEGMVREAGGPVPEWAVAVTLADDRLVFRLDRVGRGPHNATRVVLVHEAVHQALNQLRRAGRARPLPRWFEEGLCVHRAGASYLRTDYSVARTAAAGRLPPFEDADEGFRSADPHTAALAYEQGRSAVSFFLGEYRLPALRRLLRLVAEGASFRSAFARATGEELASFEERWRREVTPVLPFFLFVLMENIELALIGAAGLLVVVGYLRARRRRPAELAALGEGEPPEAPP